jgi:hypothetical protein
MWWDGGERAITAREKARIEEHGPSCFSIALVPAADVATAHGAPAIPGGLDQVYEALDLAADGPFFYVGAQTSAGVGTHFQAQPGSFSLFCGDASFANAHAIVAALNWLRENREALAATGKQQVGESNRTTVDSGALRLALNVLRRAGKGEVAEALESTAVRGQQVGEVQGDARAQFEAWAKGEGWKDDQLTRYSGGRCATAGEYHNSHLEALWYGWKAALAARQPGAQERAWLIHWSHIPLEAPEATTSASRVDAVSALTDPPRIEPLYAAPPAQGIDMGQFIALAKFGEEFAFSAEKQPHSRVVYSQASRLLALIDQRDAAPGVSP